MKIPKWPKTRAQLLEEILRLQNENLYLKRVIKSILVLNKRSANPSRSTQGPKEDPDESRLYK